MVHSNRLQKTFEWRFGWLNALCRLREHPSRKYKKHFWKKHCLGYSFFYFTVGFGKCARSVHYRLLTWNSYIPPTLKKKKKIGFQRGLLTNHAMLQLVEQIRESFEDSNCTLVISTDLFEVFYIVDQNVFLK